MSEQVVTRFAPSPTGFCISAAHALRCSIGCMRVVAAANSCCGSKTPIANVRPPKRPPRSFRAWRGLALITTAMSISQFEGAARHAEVAHQLLAKGKAYKCFSTQEEIATFP